MNDQQILDVFSKALLTRRFEEKIRELAMAGEVPSSLHEGAGQEVSQIAAIAALQDDDYILYGHRGLGYMVARDVSLGAMLCDFAGKDGGTNNGKGGCMHIVDREKGILGESGTVGGGFVISVGVGMALQRKEPGKVVAHFFGDGTSNRGTFHESMNWAAIQKLPCIYICENNGLAISVPASTSTAVENIADRAAGYGFPGVVVDGNDPEAVFEAMSAAAERARSGGGPTLIETKVTRLKGHYIADLQEYRSDAETVGESDPLPRLQQRLLSNGVISEEQLADLEASAAAEIGQAVNIFNQAPLLEPEAAMQDLYAE